MGDWAASVVAPSRLTEALLSRWFAVPKLRPPVSVALMGHDSTRD
jgi:hypothetical protein